MKSILRAAFALVLLFCYTVHAQVQTPKNVSMISNSAGYYEYLPDGYNTGTQTYPLLVFLHGSGETGNGNSDLPNVLRHGPPHLISQGQFPTSFTVNGQTFRFIVISPQFIGWPSETDVQGVINYAVSHYRVNQNRIYLTGMSMGGGATWTYAGYNSGTANRLAAIVPVCGASAAATGRSRNIANADLPVWATHNDQDPTVTVDNTNLYIQYINTAPAPTPLARKSIFNSNSHDAWTKTYDPNWKEDGVLNIYQWMLQYQRGQITLPVLLSSYTVSVNNSNKVNISWTTAQEQDNHFFTIQRSADGTNFTDLAKVNATNNFSGSTYQYIDNDPLPGTSYYRLTQTDINGRTEQFETKPVNLAIALTYKIELYPNPARDQINLRLSDAYTGKLQVRILSSGGQVIRTLDLTKTTDLLQQNIVLTGLPAGNYLLDVKGKNLSYSSVFVKQ
ncbi:MAG: T9SS type A sorting domain-containing protein [Chitinophagaceae bacterium]|nr:MAG: T9SS type A sorting domain-containing protein [Chitinophagaceae bacterium]